MSCLKYIKKEAKIPDFIKEWKEATVEGVRRLQDSYHSQKGWRAAQPGRRLGNNSAFAGANGVTPQQATTTGWDPVHNKTVVMFLIGFSSVDGTDVVGD